MPIDLPPLDVPALSEPENEKQSKLKNRKTLKSVFFPGMGFVMAGVAAGKRGISDTPTVVTRTSGTSWTVPADYNSVGSRIEVYGAGGGGGEGCCIPGAGGAGGGGGGYSRIDDFDLAYGDILYHYIGAGGFAGLNGADDGNGGPGEGTWVRKNTNSPPTSSSHGIRAYGGGRGERVGDGGTGGAGGSADYGDVNRTGGDGADGFSGTYVGRGGGGAAGSSSGGGDASGSSGGSDGGGYAGNGGDGGPNPTTDAEDGFNYGGGAGGGYGNYTLGDSNGGTGADGIVIITYYAYL